MSIARHHAEWLSLVPVSGPFLSLPVLMEAFNTGLEPHHPDQARLLRQEFGRWQDSLEKHKADPTPHRHWIKFVQANTLDLDDSLLAEGQAIPQTLQAEIAEHHELLRPNLVLIDPSTQKPRLLVQTYPRWQELTSYVANSRWKASPDTRMTELLHATGVRLGLVTNGEHWMLVDAPKGETTGYASWFASLWLEEKLTLQAFRSLLSSSRFFNVPDDQTLEALLAKSASNQQEVTDQLGYQVRRAVEVLIHSLDRADQDFGRELLAEVPEDVLYESALTVMMRLVFLFCAEERELIPSKPFPVYEQNYSVSTISKQLRELADQHGEELLERRYDAWPRLLAAFRAVFGGLQHDDVHIPAYGGRLFHPDRFPFLEGRKQGTSWREAEAHPLPVNNRTVLHLLEALQLLQIKVPGGGPAEARRLSFRALDIEQIGHVYEGLLDHTAQRATEPFLGLAGTRAKEPEIPLAQLQTLLAKGEADVVKFLKEETGKSENALKKSLKAELDLQDIARFRTACQSDDALWNLVKPLAGLVRLDNFGYPVVIPKGSVFVTAGTDRRSSGTHYTPKSLTEPIVQYTLEPLVYVGPAEGLPRSEWKLRSARELLALKICDMACGSGAFLVQVCRYLAARLLEAWDEIQQAQPGIVRITPEGESSTGKPGELLIPNDPDERLTYALRIVAQRCLYGVDKNPLAVEMAKLSLWLLTVAKDKPFEFLDHNIRCGDSLVGLSSIDQLLRFSFTENAKVRPMFEQQRQQIENRLNATILLRKQIETQPSSTPQDIERKTLMFANVEDQTRRLTYAADMLLAATWEAKNTGELGSALNGMLAEVEYKFKDLPVEKLDLEAKERLQKAGIESRFHYALEFPEVFIDRAGFDAFVCNPPFMGGLKIESAASHFWREHVVKYIAGGFRGNRGTADLCSYFLLRASSLLRRSGKLGMLATNTIAQGDTKEVGLDQMEASGGSIYRAIRSMKWPGDAHLEVAIVWISKAGWSGSFVLDDSAIEGISTRLSPHEMVAGEPYELIGCKDRAFIGSYILGMGFTLSPDEAASLILQNRCNKDVLFPYLNGEDLNSRPDQSPSRWVINFFDWPLERARTYSDCFSIVLNRVKPERDGIVGRNPESTRRGTNWWKYAQDANNLYSTINRLGLSRVLVRSRVSSINSIAFSDSGIVFSDATVVFAFDDYEHFSLFQSMAHIVWLEQHSSSMRNDIRYTPSRCSSTFCFPRNLSTLGPLGKAYYEQRSAVMASRGLGLTKVYNKCFDPNETQGDMQRLRDLHVEMDKAVAAAYGWSDLNLGHGFHETRQGTRFTISESARREVLARLLKLNHERYAEEVKQGLHPKKGAAKKAAPRKKAAGKSAPEESTLFDMEGEE